MINRTLSLILLALLLGASVVSVQAQQPSLKITGEVSHPLNLTAVDLAKLPHQKVTATDHDGKTGVWEGVSVVELLKMAGLEFGEKLRGKSLALFMVVEAADGYRAVFALPEVDPAYVDQTIILADTRDGKPLPGSAGPWQIIVPNEKMHARWVRQVVALTIRRAQ